MAIAAVAPVAVAYDAASASTDCNMLSDALTKKRMDRLQDHSDDPLHDLHHENTIRSLELILDRQNRQQGLGFTVRKIVVDLKLLASIMATLCGFGATVVPILFALRSGAAGESFTAGTDICSFTGAVDESRACWDIFSAHLHYRCSFLIPARHCFLILALVPILCVRFCCAPFAMTGTAQQVAGLQAALHDRNETCGYNQTLDLDQILAL
jgi:hypothetical protein